jgi:MoaA/NifB/PqqE/SkfB family radical SAM enzyme
MTKQNEFRKILEERYGKAPSLAVTSPKISGGGYVNGIWGWQFSENEVRDANRSGRLLTMDLDFPGNRCRLNCGYCFAKVGEKTGTYYRPGKGDSPLTIEEIKTHLREAKQLGLKSVKIIGFREPFDNAGFHEFLDFLKNLEVQPVVFTSAYTLGEDKFGGDIYRAIDFLADRSISLMIKLHTLNREKEDTIVRRKGYAERRDRILRALLDDGRFTDATPTSLGIENVLSSQDIPELLGIYEYFKIMRNVFVDIDPPIPVGRTGTLEEAEKAGLMSQEKLKELAVGIYRLNQKYGIRFNGVSPYFGGNPCTQLPNGVYLTLSGKVLTCCGGDEEIGNIRESSLKSIFKNNPHRGKNCIYHDCPYREKRGIMTTSFIQEVEQELRKPGEN